MSYLHLPGRGSIPKVKYTLSAAAHSWLSTVQWPIWQLTFTRAPASRKLRRRSKVSPSCSAHSSTQPSFTSWWNGSKTFWKELEGMDHNNNDNNNNNNNNIINNNNNNNNSNDNVNDNHHKQVNHQEKSCKIMANQWIILHPYKCCVILGPLHPLKKTTHPEHSCLGNSLSVEFAQSKKCSFPACYPCKKSTCPLKGDHFKRKFHLPTINFQGISYFSHPHLLVTEGITHGHMQQRRILRIFGKFLHDFGGHVPLVGGGFHPEKHDGQSGTLPKTI